MVEMGGVFLVPPIELENMDQGRLFCCPVTFFPPFPWYSPVPLSTSTWRVTVMVVTDFPSSVCVSHNRNWWVISLCPYLNPEPLAVSCLAE